ncbi:hypothetical protein AB0G15_05785 [Streptosporangium sp. NPDC023825]|uniref:hypothetical protein n=1 Tax=Streptosporangium sp. NPDC023825 TaxID=3154909 RepID=UPI003443EBC8
MSEYEITITAARGGQPHDELTYDVLNDDLAEAKAEIRETFGDAYRLKDSGDAWEGNDLFGLSLAYIWKLAQIAEEQQSPGAFMAWLLAAGELAHGLPDKMPERFAEVWQGTFGTYAEFAQWRADEDGVPNWLFTCIDWDKAGRGIAQDYSVIELRSGEIAVFRKNSQF